MSEIPPSATNTQATEAQPQHKPLHQCMRESIQRYLSQLDGEEPCNLYALILEEIEPPLLEAVMIYCKGNQSRAARALDISRGTLRTKLNTYFNNRKLEKKHVKLIPSNHAKRRH